MIEKRLDKSPLAIASRWRIEASFIAAPIGLWFAHPTAASTLRWIPLAVAGLALRCWARGHLERRAQLTQSGPYAFVRNPLYVGSFLLGLAFCLMTNTPALAIFFVVAFLAAYVPKGMREAAFLRERYGDEYERYAARVPAALPRIRLGRDESTPPATLHFAWRRVLRHREYLTWIGATAGLVAMWAFAK